MDFYTLNKMDYCNSKNTLTDVNTSAESNTYSDDKRFKQILHDLRSYKKLSESDLKFVEQLNHNDKNELIRIYNLVLDSIIDLSLN